MREIQFMGKESQNLLWVEVRKNRDGRALRCRNSKKRQEVFEDLNSEIPGVLLVTSIPSRLPLGHQGTEPGDCQD